MTREDVIARVARIRAMVNDDATAHFEQDALYVEVLRAIASETIEGAGARALAQEALKVQNIEFSRWYA